MKGRYYAGCRKTGDARTNFLERLDPEEPIFRPVATDLHSRLALQRCHIQWRATVSQKRAKAFGFFSFVKGRREMRVWRIRNAERAAAAVRGGTSNG